MNLNKLRLKILNSYFVSSVSITFVLLILGFFALFLFNTRDLSKSAKESITVSLVLKPDAEKGKIDVLVNKIAMAPFCRQIKIITPDEALDDLKQELGEDIADVLDFNPLPTTLSLNLNEKYANTDSLQLIVEALKHSKIVDEIYYNRSLVHTLDKNIRKITVAVSILEILLLLMAYALINNTIRLLIYSKRFEIKTMQLVGATTNFIMKPFLKRAFLHGFFSSLFVIALLIAGILYYQSSVDDVIKIAHIEIVFVLILLAGLIITILSTFLSVNSYLNTDANDLYL
jgi:cell division transport system permease protein